MNEGDFPWIRYTVIPFLIWVWSWLKYWLVGMFVAWGIQWMIKIAVREVV